METNNITNASNTELKITVELTKDNISLLERYGYEKRSGGGSYPNTHNRIIIIPFKKWYWTDANNEIGLSNFIL
jgi:hypothetical protein